MATSIINTKIGTSKNVARVWIEGQQLAHAGIEIGTRYGVLRSNASGIELGEVDDNFEGQTFLVSKRARNGIDRPLMEIRSKILRDVFETIDMVRVALRKGRIVITANFMELKVKERLTRILEKLKNKSRLAVLSCFHGGGVLDSALHSGLARQGVNSFIQVGIELESDYLDSSLRNNSELWTDDSVAICSDIRLVNWQSGVPQADLILGGIPCVGASRSGKSKNRISLAEEHSDAGTLFIDYINAVRAVNPAICILENVVEYQNTASMCVIRSSLNSLGYNVYETVLNGNEMGVLENRSRLAMVAITKSMDEGFSIENLIPTRVKEDTLSDILDDIPLDSPRYKTFSYLADKELRDKAAGKGFTRQLLDGSESYCGVIGKGYNKCRSTEPFIVHPENPELSRLLTPKEHARVKGIPERIINNLSETTSHEILGQSICFPAFESLAMRVGEMLQRFASHKDNGLAVAV